jgi:hypothetical protein
MWEAHNWPRATRVALGVYVLVGVVVGLAVGGSFLLWPDEGLAHVIRPEAAALITLTMPVMIVLMIALHAPAAFANPRIGPGARAAWLAGFALAGIVAVPAYWWLHVLRAPYGPVDAAAPETDAAFWLRPRSGPAGGSSSGR